MSNRLEALKGYAGLFSRGLILEMAPKISGGMMNELFHQWNMDFAKLTEYVRENKSLWSMIEPEQHEQLRALAEKVGDLDFLTADVLINGIRKDFPGVASLFLNWPEAGDWLLLQIEELKAQVNNPSNIPTIDNTATV